MKLQQWKKKIGTCWSWGWHCSTSWYFPFFLLNWYCWQFSRLLLHINVLFVLSSVLAGPHLQSWGQHPDWAGSGAAEAETPTGAAGAEHPAGDTGALQTVSGVTEEAGSHLNRTETIFILRWTTTNAVWRRWGRAWRWSGRTSLRPSRWLEANKNTSPPAGNFTPISKQSFKLFLFKEVTNFPFCTKVLIVIIGHKL